MNEATRLFCTAIANDAGWFEGGDEPGRIWFYKPYWGSWKAAVSWHDVDAVNKREARVFDDLEDLMRYVFDMDVDSIV